MARGGRRKNAGRKSRWNHVPTRTIRVPKALADKLIEVAECLDRGGDVELHFPPEEKVLPAKIIKTEISVHGNE